LNLKTYSIGLLFVVKYSSDYNIKYAYLYKSKWGITNEKILL